MMIIKLSTILHGHSMRSGSLAQPSSSSSRRLTPSRIHMPAQWKEPYGLKLAPPKLKEQIRYETHLAILACKIMNQAVDTNNIAFYWRDEGDVNLPEHTALEQRSYRYAAAYVTPAAMNPLGKGYFHKEVTPLTTNLIKAR